MEEKVIILPLDGYESAESLFLGMEEVMSRRGMAELVAYIKVNDGLHNIDSGGPYISRQLSLVCARYVVKLFVDMKIFDVSATVVNVLKKYWETNIGILTVSSQCSIEGIAKLRALLPNTKLAMVSVPTDISADECLTRFGMTPQVKIYNDLANIRRLYQEKYGVEINKIEPFDLVVCSPLELPFLRRNIPEQIGFVVPGIRDAWMLKSNEHQKRTTGIAEAIDLGATYVVAGAQLTKGNPELGIGPRESCMRTAEQIRLSNRFRFTSPLEVLKACGGYYHAPKDEKGNYVGPLVAYAGTYDAEDGVKNYVGFEFYNFARAETLPKIRSYFAGVIADKLKQANISSNVVLGAPMGGILLSGAIGKKVDIRTAFAEKEIIVPADKAIARKEESRLIIGRHDLYVGEDVIIVEDVCNNFSTTAKLRKLINSRGAKLSAIVCAFNRSGQESWEGVPVISAQFIPTKQFQQDAPEVIEQIVQKNIFWSPKPDWDELLEFMKK